ncbi:DUF4124 domain-containing protein [Comamonas sp. NLF-1-9]|nr:DUF4124 domain-containing protein [Comamonas sp. NLF-1-9]
MARAAMVLAAAVATSALAQAPAGGAGLEVYTCIDKNGRKLTSDRFIAECSDREQRVLDASGAERRRIGPVLTEHERAAQEAERRQRAQARAQEIAERRAERVLITRYPDVASHRAQRELTLGQVDEVIEVAQRRIEELRAERKRLDEELEFYNGALYQAPVKLQRQFADNEQASVEQQRFIASKQEEKKRINERFDEELAKLRQLWAQQRAAQEALSPKAGKP